MQLKEILWKHTLSCLAAGFVIGLAVVGIGAGFSAASGTPAFCGNCHSMKGEAKSFAVSSHSQLDCVECHLPHDNAVIYYVEKGRTGMADMYHEAMRDYPARIKLSEGARLTVNRNCLRCHSGTMEGVYVDLKKVKNDTGADCLKCHSSVAHGSNHLEGGIKVE